MLSYRNNPILATGIRRPRQTLSRSLTDIDAFPRIDKTTCWISFAVSKFQSKTKRTIPYPYTIRK